MLSRDRVLGGVLGEGFGGRSRALFYGRLAVCAACLLLGAFPVLAGLGLLELEGPVEPLAIPFVLLFGAVFVALGVAAVWGPLRTMAAERGATTRREVRDLVMRKLRRRVDRHSLVGAASLLVLASGYWSVVAGGSTGGSASRLAPVLTIEFLTVHAFPFVVVAGVFAASDARGFRGLGAVLLAVLVAAYGTLAWVFAGGAVGLAWLAWLLVPNVTPFVRERPADDARPMAVSRWVVKFSVFMLVSGIVGGGDLGGPDAYPVGAAYFTVVAVIELFRLIDVPVDLARAWAGGDAQGPPEAEAAAL